MAESEADVRREADPTCRVCHGAGWHWGWELLISRGRHRQRGTGNPIRLRCPCVDQTRAAVHVVEWMERGDCG